MRKWLLGISSIQALSLLFLLSGCVSTPSAQHADAIAVWQHHDGRWEIYYSIWDNASKKWYVPAGGASAPISVGAGDDNDPAISSNDTSAIAVWSENSSGSIMYSVWGGSGWSTPAIISQGGNDTHPTIALDPSGDALSVWMSGPGSLSWSYYRGGTGWSQPAKLDTTGISIVSMPAVAYSVPEGRYFLVFTGNNGSANFAYAAGFGPAGWSVPVAISDKDAAVVDFDTPASHRTGIAAAEGKKEVTVVWPGPYDQLYSAKLGDPARAYSFGQMPDVAYDVNDTAVGAMVRDNNVMQEPDVNDPGGASVISSLRPTDRRPSLAFLRDGNSRIALWWNKLVGPGEIYFSYAQGDLWIGAERIDSSLDNSANRNPAVTAFRSPTPLVRCGDGILDSPEQCEIGTPCQGGAFCANDCMCHPSQYALCGDGSLDWPWERCETSSPCQNQSQYCAMPPCACKDKPVTTMSCARNSLSVGVTGQGLFVNSTMICKDDCSSISPALSCDPKTCTCVGNATAPSSQNLSCAGNTVQTSSGMPSAFNPSSMKCQDDCVAYGNTDLSCDPQTCTCKERKGDS
jgi:hypothetical protein